MCKNGGHAWRLLHSTPEGLVPLFFRPSQPFTWFYCSMEPPMKPLHVALAVLVAVIWGIAFVISKLGLESFSPPQLTALRFIVAALAAPWLPRPDISWTALIAIGLTVFTGQF